jgi:hypothetical protein
LQLRLQKTFFLVLVRCLSEEKVWSAVSVGNSAILVIVLLLLSIALAPLSIALAPPSIALAPLSIALSNKKMQKFAKWFN